MTNKTCHLVYTPPEYPYHIGMWTCSNCGHWWMKPPYDLSKAEECPYCGAEVVDGD